MVKIKKGKRFLSLFLLFSLIMPLFSGLIVSNADTIENKTTGSIEEENLELFWLNNGEKLKEIRAELNNEKWESTIIVEGKVSGNNGEELSYIIDTGESLDVLLKSDNINTEINKLDEKGKWEVKSKYPVRGEENYQETISMEINSDSDKIDGINIVSLISDKDKKDTISLDLVNVKKEDINNNKAEIDKEVNEEIVPNISTLSDEIIANLSISEAYSNKNPLSGSDFTMNVMVNSSSIAESQLSISGIKVKVELPDTVDITSLPSSNAYKLTQIGNTIEIEYLDTLEVGTMLSIPFKLRFKKGVSTTDTKLDGKISVTANNANPSEKALDGITPKNNDKIQFLEGVLGGNVATNAHTSKFTLKSEADVGGLNIKNGKLIITVPEDADLYSVKYNNVEYYKGESPENGIYTVEIPVDDIIVGDAKREVVLTYKYPYPEEEEKDYEIKAQFSGDRFNGEKIEEESIIKETAYPKDKIDFPGTKFFEKNAPSVISKLVDYRLIYSIKFIPELDMRNAYLVDDPLRNDIETDFFDGYKYEIFAWSAEKSASPEINSLVSTEVLYKTNKNDSWRSMGPSRTSGKIYVSNLGLEEDEYITTVKYDFSYEGTKSIPASAGVVNIEGIGKTLEGIKDNSKSLNDGITNTMYIYGDIKFPGDSEATYTPFVEGGYDANNDDAGNTKKVTTKFSTGAIPGYTGWEQPFTPLENKIGDTFEFKIAINNTGGGGPLKDPILYVVVPTSIDIESAEVINTQTNPNVEINIRQINSSQQLVEFKYNQDWKNGEGWNWNHGVKIKASGSKAVNSSEIFDCYLISGDPEQEYEGGVAGVNIPGVGYKNAAMSRWREVKFIRSLGAASKKELTLDGNTFNRVNNSVMEQDGLDMSFKIEVPNTGVTKIEEVHIIDNLPKVNDTMTISSNSKNSTVNGIVTGIKQLDETTLGSNFELYYSEDATAENNLLELKELNNSKSTWISWDGQSELPREASAIKIIKKDGLEGKETLSLLLDYRVENITNEKDILWNSFAVGGNYIEGENKPSIEVGEPMKSGIYLTKEIQTNSIAGTVWKDSNGNGLRETDEKNISSVKVSLYDWNNDLIAETITDGNGKYKFDNLVEGNYKVEIKKNNSSLMLTKYKIGDDKTIDSDFLDSSDESLGIAKIDLSTETNPLNIDAGYLESTNISGYVWVDSDENGLKTSGENTLSNHKVDLYKVEDGKEVYVKSTNTNSEGKYNFYGDNIVPGEYVLKLEVPSSYKMTVKGDLNNSQTSKFNDSGSTDIITIKDGKNENWNAGLILDIQPAETYVVTYDGNENTSGEVPVDSSEYSSGEDVIVLGNTGKLEKTRHKFLGWSEDKDATTPTYAVDENGVVNPESFKITKDTILYAIWEETYVVTYDGNGNTSGEVPVDSNEYSSEEDVTVLGNTGKLEKTRHKFLGWSEDKDATTPTYAVDENGVVNPESFKITKDTILYAIWEETYVVTYDGNGNTSGEVPVDSNEYSSEEDVTVLGNTGKLEKTRHKFLGWSEDKDATTPTYAVDENGVVNPESFKITKDTILYAIWEETYVVTYDGNGNTSGEVPVDSNEYSSEEDVTVLGNTGKLEKTRHKFLGWSEDKDATTPTYAVDENGVVNPESFKITKDTILYAIWEEEIITEPETTEPTESTKPTISKDSEDYNNKDKDNSSKLPKAGVINLTVMSILGVSLISIGAYSYKRQDKK
ncbi:SdrD B-like domain-containing protein [Miniphocaeibacter massiliensis]|uniref:SdrD B-like domain-containing protein n=1 Tax=Miniphocaeibacter massiliensis TaxID=2041841 RepID=UPI000C068BDC|nr:SdrD B-like domain-containing protein [Miniphocaeibacter massiliensis]